MKPLLDQLAATAIRERLPWREEWRLPIERLLSLLAKFATRTNLVGNPSPQAVVEEHIVEALVVAAVVEEVLSTAPDRVVDVGAGAGIETLILARCWPQARVVAVERRRRRAEFIEVAADAMGVGRRVEVIAEDLASSGLQSGFQVATSRATFEPDRWLSRARPLVTPGGVVIVHATSAVRLANKAVAGGRLVAHRAVPTDTRHEVIAWCADRS